VVVALPGGRTRPVPRSPSTYRRRRALAAGAVVAVSALATLVLGSLGGGSLTAPERPLAAGAGRTYVVQPGDTFWSIARQVEPEGDLRPVVDRLVAEHGGATLVVGEPIRLPLRT
jgi:Tfp pilus assembly protein FimV